MQLYRPLQIVVPRNRPTAKLPDHHFWQKFHLLQTFEYQLTPCALACHDNDLQRIAIVTNRKTQVFCAKQRKIIQQIPSGKESSTSGDLRTDGKLVAIGKKSSICLHELEQKALLRRFEMSGVTSTVAFITSNLLYAGSIKGLHGFDIAVETPLVEIPGLHSEAIKKILGGEGQLIRTASYDGTIKTIDLRAMKAIEEIEVGGPVEDMAVLGGHFLASAVQNVVKIWDCRNLSKELHSKRLSQKTLSCLQQFDERRLMIGSVDQHLRVWDWEEDKLTYSIKMQSPITQLCTTKDRSHVAIGHGNGKVLIRARKQAQQDERDEGEIDFTIPHVEQVVKNTAYFNRGGQSKPQQHELVVKKIRLRLSKYDRLLRKFQFAQAIEMATKKHDVAAFLAVFQDIEQKGQLLRTVRSFSDQQAETVVKFIKDKIGNPECDEHLSVLLQTMVDSQKNWPCLSSLVGELTDQVQLRKEMAELAGSVQLALFE